MLLACMQRHMQCFHTGRGISPGSSDRSILQSNGLVDIVADYHNVNFLRSPNQACSHFMWGRSETRYYMRTTSQVKLVSPPPPPFFSSCAPHATPGLSTLVPDLQHLQVQNHKFRNPRGHDNLMRRITSDGLSSQSVPFSTPPDQYWHIGSKNDCLFDEPVNIGVVW